LRRKLSTFLNALLDAGLEAERSFRSLL
jgi:hypothetical protein